jgi:hypothetical protein
MPFPPGVNERAIRDQFAAVSEQNVEFDGCRISVSESRAVAVCSGTVTSTLAGPEGRANTLARSWRFVLDRKNDRWTIARVAVGASQH